MSILPVSFALILAPLASLMAQGELRGWSATSFDTSAFEVSTRSIAVWPAWNTAAVVRMDGQLFVYGNESGFGGICTPPSPPPGLGYVAASTSAYHGLALRTDGQIDSWNSQYVVVPPVPALPPGMTYTSIAAGGAFGLAVRSDGQIVAWGDNSAGQCMVPPVPAGARVLKICASHVWAMALLSDGSILGWGLNYVGQLSIPTLRSGVRFVDIAVGVDHAAAILSDGTAIAWGDNSVGQCNVPAAPAGMSYGVVACGYSNTVLLRSDQVLVAAGDNTYGQCAVPSVPLGRTCSMLAMGFGGGLALLSDHSVIGWGQSTIRPLPAVGSARWKRVACGDGHFLALASDGRLQGWPEGAITGVTTVPSLPPGEVYTDVVSGLWHAGALRSDHQLVMWGLNQDGRCTPPALPPGQRYEHMFLSDTHSVAIRSDGMAVAFGGSWSTLTIPALPSGVAYLKAGLSDNSLLLLRSDGVVVPVLTYASSMRSVPLVPTRRAIVDLAVVDDKAFGLLSDGQVLQWGGVAPPVPALPAGVVYVEMASGLHHLVLRRSDGQVVVHLSNVYLEHSVPALQPGECFLQVSARFACSAARVGRTSSYVAYANGCSGSLPVCRLVPGDTPKMGEALNLRLHDLPLGLAILVFGWQRGPTVDLAPFGAPGCHLEVSVDASLFLVGSGQQARFAATLPNAVSVLGTTFRNQAIVLDPAGNALGAVLSDACEGVVGG